MIELPIRRMSRKRKSKVQGDNFDGFAESLVAEEYGLSELTDSDWYDCVLRSTGTKYEVKSTSSRIRSGPGRFRLWEQQHRSLTTAEGQNAAWYAFVLLDLDDGVVRIQRRRPSTVTGIINGRGGWNRSGHQSKGRQHKLPIDEVF
jgi:hypothetical protein